MPDQYLQVDLLVDKNNAADFESKSTLFHQKGGFSRILNDYSQPPRYELVLALRSTVTFPFKDVASSSGTPEQDSKFERDFYRKSTYQAVTPVYRYVHLWKIRRDEDLNLAPLMRACGDDEQYLAIDALVLEETQNFISRVRTPGQVAQFNDNRRFVRTTRKLSHADLGLYIFNQPMLYPPLEAAGWHHLGQYQTFSGMLNIVTEFWQTRSEDPLSKMFASVEKPSLPKNAPAQALKLFKIDTRESFVKLDYSTPQGTSL
jgi:hypothetical protein